MPYLSALEVFHVKALYKSTFTSLPLPSRWLLMTSAVPECMLANPHPYQWYDKAQSQTGPQQSVVTCFVGNQVGLSLEDKKGHLIVDTP